VVERLKKLVTVKSKKDVRRPKAASKMLVAELREELEGQGLPTDGNRTVLYQRVQKARRINRSRGRPLWVPPVEEKEEEVYLNILSLDEILISTNAYQFSYSSHLVLFFIFLIL
jgi:SAP domain